MKKTNIMVVGITALMTAAAFTGCSNAANDLQRATRGNGAYDTNYDYSGGKNGFGTNNFDGFGAGYWDYYGITNGSANDTMRNEFHTGTTGTYAHPNAATDSTMRGSALNNTNDNYGASGVYGTVTDDAAQTSTVKVDAAAAVN